jgi:transcriptional regulatory protein LevR
VCAADQGGGVLLLVDFASLLSLGELVMRQVGIQVRTVSEVSAPLVVEAVRRAQRSEHVTLDQLAASLTLFRTVDEPGKTGTLELIHDEYSEKDTRFSSSQDSRVILSICLTGYGSATKIAELIEEHLPDLRRQRVEIICMDINLSGKTEADVQRLVGNRHVVAIVGTINPHLKSYPFIALTDFLFGDGIARLRTLLGGTLIDPALLQPDSPSFSVYTEQTWPGSASVAKLTQRTELVREISHTLTQRLLFLNPVRAMPLIDHMIELIEVEVGETFEIEVLAGLMLHLACILERGIQPKGMLVSETVRTQVEHLFPRELSICRRALQVLSTQIARPLPDEEAYNIVGILRQVDIFIATSF